MTRRIAALATIVVIVALLAVLVWGVYQHHQTMHRPEEVVTGLASQAAFSAGA